MSTTYEKLKALLEADGTLSTEKIEEVVAESGEMTEEEKIQLEADRLQQEKATKPEVVAMDAYLEALKVLDTEPEDSDKFKEAEAIVEKYERGV